MPESQLRTVPHSCVPSIRSCEARYRRAYLWALRTQRPHCSSHSSGNCTGDRCSPDFPGSFSPWCKSPSCEHVWPFLPDHIPQKWHCGTVWSYPSTVPDFHRLGSPLQKQIPPHSQAGGTLTDTQTPSAYPHWRLAEQTAFSALPPVSGSGGRTVPVPRPGACSLHPEMFFHNNRSRNQWPPRLCQRSRGRTIGSPGW